MVKTASLNPVADALGFNATEPGAAKDVSHRVPGTTWCVLVTVPSAFVGTIVEGHFNDTPLSGLNWAALYKWPGEIKDGNGRRQIVIDERADEAQRIALETIISGEACEPLSNLFSVFASTCSEYCETLFLPIDLDADLEAASVEHLLDAPENSGQADHQ